MHVYSITEGPVKVAFIQYNSINELLKPAKNKEDRVDKLVISDVISASIGQSNNQSDSELHVAQPVRFNFETGHVSYFFLFVLSEKKIFIFHS